MANESNLVGQQIQGYTITKELGSGGYGTVYLGVKEDLGKEYQTAIKHISMPDADGYESVLQDYGYDLAATQAHFEKLVAGITSEINTLLDLSKMDNRYIVAYYDHDIQKTISPLRFEIFMRMEYLTPLNRFIRQNGVTVGEVLKLGLNMCDALALCHNNDVMHRDIKEANIFISDTGNYKLGDFGVAKVAMESTQAGSIKGTASYMAPEIYLREPYDKNVDIYSLGIVLYKLLNNQRLPFMPDAPASFTADDKNSAETKRLKGETPPLPVNARNRLGEIVVKACSNKAQRYATAEEFKKDLSEYIATLTESEYDAVVVAQASDDGDAPGVASENSATYTQTQGATMTMGVQNDQFTPPSAQQNPYADTGNPKSKKKKIIILASIIAVVLIAAAIALVMFLSKKNDPVNKFETAVQSGDFVSAAQLYRDELRFGDSDKLSEAEQFVVGHAEGIRDSYLSEALEYEDALAQLQETGKLGIVSESELAPLIAEVNEMRTSRAAFEKAGHDIEAGDYQSAISELHKVILDDKNYSEAQTQLASSVKGYKEKVMEEVSYFNPDKRYDDAISALRAALLVVPDDADFLTKIADYEKQIAADIALSIDTIIREARGRVTNGADYEGAMSDLRAGLSTYPNSEELKTALADTQSEFIARKIAEANNLIADSADYATALSDLRSLSRQYANSYEIKDAISLIEGNYISMMLSAAADIAATSEYEKAVAKLNEALVLVPDDASIKSTITDYEARYPTLLQQMTYFTGGGLGNGGQDQDNMQGDQVNVITGVFSNTYKLNGEYKKITGTIYQPFATRSSYYKRTFEIYGDTKLLYSVEMGGGLEPIDFSVDITGVKDIRIRLVDNIDSYGSRGSACLANVLLYQ